MIEKTFLDIYVYIRNMKNITRFYKNKNKVYKNASLRARLSSAKKVKNTHEYMGALCHD